MVYDHEGSGLLSSPQREYLAGESDIEPKSVGERQIRSRIRGRLRNAILDFELVHNELDEKDRSLLLDDIRADLEENGHLRDGLGWGIAWAIRFGMLAGSDAETLVEEGVLRTDREIGSVKADIEIECRNEYVIGTVTEKLQSGQKPEPWEIEEAWVNGELDETHREKLIEIRGQQPEVDTETGTSDWENW